MKVRLTQPGFERYSGQMGVLQFVDGLSTSDCSPHDARRMAAVMKCEWEDGSDPNMAQHLLDSMNTPAPDVNVSHDTAGEKAAAMQQARADLAPANRWTKETLEAEADKHGIKGLRAIADPMDVKGTSIAALIEAILKKQDAPAA